MRCEYIQGFMISKPVPAAEIADLLCEAANSNKLPKSKWGMHVKGAAA